jgi:fructokinase
MNDKQKIAGLGEVLWDVYEDKKYLGGAPANFAAHVNQAGAYGVILSRVGNDAAGDQLIKELVSLDFDVSGIQIDPQKPTGTVKVTLNEEGVPAFQCVQDVSYDYMEYNDIWDNIAGEIDAVLFGTLAQRSSVSRKAIQQFLQKTTAIRVFDINLRGWSDHIEKIVIESLKLADMIKLNIEELEKLKNLSGPRENNIEFLRQLIDNYQLKMAALTAGSEGCYLITKNENVYHPGFKVNAVDTTGAGDAFAAGMIVKYLSGAPLADIADYGNRLGAFVSTQRGAIPKWRYSDIMSID